MKTRNLFRSRFLYAGVAGSAGLTVSTFRYSPSTEHAGDSFLSNASTGSLIRCWAVYRCCQYPFVVDASDTILHFANSIPGVKQVSKYIIRHTFFAQFAGGETAEECVPLIQSLRQSHIGSLLHYSVEAENHASSANKGRSEVEQEHVRETIRAIKVCGDENRKEAKEGKLGSAWIAVKMTGLADPDMLERISTMITKAGTRKNITYPGTPDDSFQLSGLHADLSIDDLNKYRSLHTDLRKIMDEAIKHGVRILIDAEHSWFQPATDLMQMRLAMEYNRLEERSAGLPMVYGTYQAYLRRNIKHLEESIAHARANNYALGVKLVRGAYMEQELAHWQTMSERPHDDPPCWSRKDETDRCYQESFSIVLRELSADLTRRNSGIALLAATHNRESAKCLIRELVEQSLTTVRGGRLALRSEIRGRVCLGQLYGMSDELTGLIAEKFSPTGEPVVLKYIPYGALDEVIPYLSRRAIENKAVLTGDHGARQEADRVVRELRRRVGNLFTSERV